MILMNPELPDSQTKMAFHAAVRSYFIQNNMDADWDLLDKLSIIGVGKQPV